MKQRSKAECLGYTSIQTTTKNPQHLCRTGPEEQRPAAHQLSFVSSLKLSFSQHLLINSPPSPHLLLLCHCYSMVIIALSLTRGKG